VWSATPTPFLEDGSLDAGGIERTVEHHVRLGVKGLFVGGTCGEGPFMPDAQRVELVRRMKKAAGGRLHVMAQVSDTSAARVKENMRRLTDAGADSLALAPPPSLGFGSRAFLRRYFLEPMEQAAIPLAIYIRKMPGPSDLDLDFWKEVIAHPKVKFVKDSSASADCIPVVLAAKTARPDLRVMTGNEFDVIAPVAAGYDGGLLGTGILNAGYFLRAFEALAAGKRTEADAWQRRSNEFLYDLFARDVSQWLGGLKYALKALGLFSSEYAHLVYPLRDEDRRRIDAALAREREIILPES
jgi:dihydrodipicolinate synthase/N-acetylneuraminate lyase